jgi:hypothetical protein
VLNEIDVIVGEPQGATNTDMALETLYQEIFTASNGDRSGVRNIAIVVTSGQSQDASATFLAARQVHTAGIEVYAVAYETPSEFMFEINRIASSPITSHVQTFGTYDSPSTIANNLLDALCG